MATRFYFPSTTLAAVAPANNGTWNRTDLKYRKLQRHRTNTPMTLGNKLGPGRTGVVADRCYVSDPLTAQTISGTVKAQFLADKHGASAVADRLEIYVVSRDGLTVRGTLLAVGAHGPATGINSTLRNKTYADGDALSSVAAQLGDRLVVMVGYNLGGTDNEAQIQWGDWSGIADALENETAVSGLPWVEFSGTIAFEEVAAPGTEGPEPYPWITEIPPVTGGGVTIGDSTPARTAVPSEGVDEHYVLVRVTGSPATGLVFEDYKLLDAQHQRFEWWYYRNGGCGPFRFHMREELPESDLAILEGWEIHVRIKLPAESDYTTWYRGVIRSIHSSRNGNEVLCEARGYGYVEMLNMIQVQRIYPPGLTVSAIVNDIIENDIKPHSRIVRPSDLGLGDSGVDAPVTETAYITAGEVHFECSALKALKFLADLQGNYEFGVDARRCIYFRDNTTVGISKNFFIDRDPIDLVGGGKAFDKLNQIKVEGKQFGVMEFLRIKGDPTDVTRYGLFERPIEVPWVTNDRDADRWADNIIARHASSEHWKTFTWQGVDRRLESPHPMNKIVLYGMDVTAVREEFRVGKIQYVKGGFARKGELKEIGDPVQQARVHQPVIVATIYAGAYRRDLVEELEQNLYDQVAAIKGKHKQFRNPQMVSVLPSEGRIGEEEVALFDPTLKVTYPFGWDRTAWWPRQRARRVNTLPAYGIFPGEHVYVVNGSSYKFYWWTGTAWVEIASSSSGQTRITKVSDEQVDNSNTLQDDDDLQFEMEANTTYSIRLVAFISAGATPDFKYQINGPAAPTLVLRDIRNKFINSATIASVALVSAFDVIDRVIPGASGHGCIQEDITVKNGPTPGTFKLMWSQNVATTSDPATVHAGSYIEYQAVT